MAARTALRLAAQAVRVAQAALRLAEPAALVARQLVALVAQAEQFALGRRLLAVQALP